jgi:hypothetical protein
MCCDRCTTVPRRRSPLSLLAWFLGLVAFLTALAHCVR